MSADRMGRQMALAMAGGHVDQLPRLTRHATPEFAQQLLLAYYRMRDVAEASRGDFEASTPLGERVAVANVLAEIEAAIDDTKAWLSRVARRGGKGLPPPGAGRSPADMGHGCPAPSPAVGPAPEPAAEAGDGGMPAEIYITPPADRLFFASEVKDLPEANPVPYSLETSEETP